MTSGDTDSNPGDRQLKLCQPLPIVTDDIMARRLKNRERQRRYRARKRLEADMKKSYSLEQQTLLPNASSYGAALKLDPHGVQVHSNETATRFEARVYCGRKWKKDARNADMSMVLADASKGPDLSAKSPMEAGPNLVLEYHTNSNGRRDWKADARSKMDVDTRGNDPADG